MPGIPFKESGYDFVWLRTCRQVLNSKGQTLSGVAWDMDDAHRLAADSLRVKPIIDTSGDPEWQICIDEKDGYCVRGPQICSKCGFFQSVAATKILEANEGRL